MKRFMIRVFCVVLSIATLFTLFPFRASAASLPSINDSSVFLKQASDNTCTLAASTMMLRRRAVLDRNSNWNAITESSVKSVAWGSSGLSYSFTYEGMTVNTLGLISNGYDTVAEKKAYFISLLETNPEGIVIYEHNKPHAVLLTDYDKVNDVFYCADSALGTGRILLSKSSLTGSNETAKIDNLKQIWRITDNKNEYIPPLNSSISADEYIRCYADTALHLAVAYPSNGGSITSWKLPWTNTKNGSQDSTLKLGTISGNIRILSVVENHSGNIWYEYDTGTSTRGFVYSGDILFRAKTTVTLDANGGNVSTGSIRVDKNYAYGDLPVPSRSGHTFDGWYTAKTGGTRVNRDTKVSNASDHTLYAHWTQIVVTEPNYSGVSHSNITKDNALIKATCNNPSRITLKTGGYYLSTKEGAVANGTKITDNISSGYQTAAAIPCSYDLKNEYGWTLSEGTKYYYVLYVTDSAGKSYYSPEYSFMTSGHTHSYSNTETKPTCTLRGYTTHTCSCGDSYVDSYVNALGHTMGNWATTKKPTCTIKGERQRSCANTGCTYIEKETIVATGHSYNAEITEPTCTAQGYTTHICTCGDSYVDTYVSALGHKFGTWSYYDVGQERRDCGNCDFYETRKKEDENTGNLTAPVIKASSISSSGKPKVSWNAVNGAAKYEVYSATSRTGKYTRLITTTKTSVTNSSAEAGKTYYYKVRAVAADGSRSDYSNIDYRTCDLPRPVAEASNVSSTGKIKVSWDKIAGASKYEVYRATSKTGTYKLQYTTADTGITDTGVTAGKTYYYKVKAIHEKTAANSAYSQVVNRTCDLAQPVVKAGNVASTGKVKLSWNKIDGASEYEVYRATSKTGTYKLLDTTTNTSMTNSSTTAGKTYYYKVKAIHEKSAANSAYSEIESRTCDLARPSVTISLSSGKPKLEWKEVEGAEEYEVYRATSEKGTYKLMKTTSKTRYTNTGATAGKTYYYKVKAIHSKSSANSAYSAAKSIKSK